MLRMTTMNDADAADTAGTPRYATDDATTLSASNVDRTAAWWSPGVAGIGTASFLSDVGHEIPTALLPSLLTSTLGAPASVLGLIEGISDGLAGLAKLGGGALADDPTRRRRIAIGGYATTAVLAASTGAATATWHVGLLRAGAWTARGLRVPARNALLADIVPPAAYGRAYGFERAMDNLGAIGGPLLAIGLINLFSIRTAIALSVIPGLMAAVAILYAIRHTPTPKRTQPAPIRLRIRGVLTPPFGRVFAGITAFELGNCAATLLILRATQLLTVNHDKTRAATLALVLYVAYNTAATIVSFPAGHAADKTRPTLVLTAGTIAFAAAYSGLARDTTNLAVLGVLFIAAGIGIGLVETAEHAAVAANTAATTRGSAFGLLAATQSVGNLAASAIAGIIWTAASPSWAFAYLTAWMITATILLGTTRRLPAAVQPVS